MNPCNEIPFSAKGRRCPLDHSSSSCLRDYTRETYHDKYDGDEVSTWAPVSPIPGAYRTIVHWLDFASIYPSTMSASMFSMFVPQVDFEGFNDFWKMVDLDLDFDVFTSTECVICLDASPTITFVPCGHKCLCNSCSDRMTSDLCPLCRTRISKRCEN